MAPFKVILQTVEDVFQIKGRGTVATGLLGPGWDYAKPGEEIEVCLPDGRRLKTAVTGKELRSTRSPEVQVRGIVLGDTFTLEQLRGAEILRLPPRTVVRSSFGEYLASEGPLTVEEECERNAQLSRFPHSVMLQVSYPELHFANRWCWQQFGPPDGTCADSRSEYRVCPLNEPHSHAGKWTSRWWVKTQYDFGFNEWYFAEHDDFERFLANVENLNYGENYPK